MASKNYVLPDTDTIKQLLAKEYDSSTGVIIRLAWQAGLMASEIVNLHWEDIDFDARSLSVSGRTVPICNELIEFLSLLEQKGTYVVYSRKSKGGPASRISIATKARKALESVGQSEIQLLDLRFDYILGALKTLPLEQVSRDTGCELRTLQEIYKRYSQQEDKPPKRARKMQNFDAESLQRALDVEGDTLDAQIIRLSWMGGLSLSEMSQLKWADVDLQHRVLRINGKERQIPPELATMLNAGKAADDQYVLQGLRSGSQLDVYFLSRRVGEFFSRHGIEQFTINAIRGKYLQKSDQDIKLEILDLISEKCSVSLEDIQSRFNCSKDKARSFLHELEQEGKIKRDGKRYMPSTQKTSWEQFLDCANTYLGAHPEVSFAQLAELTGFGSSLLAYYLRRAVSQGVLVKCGRTGYRLG